jgi:hypothetical protein
MMSARLGASELRIRAGMGAESFLAGEVGPRQLRSQSYGLEIIQPIHRRWSVRTGVHHWVPERGGSGVFVHLGCGFRYGRAGAAR